LIGVAGCISIAEGFVSVQYMLGQYTFVPYLLCALRIAGGIRPLFLMGYVDLERLSAGVTAAVFEPLYLCS